MDKFPPQFADPISQWRRKFAWHPVYTVDRGWQWLRFVYARRVQIKPHLYPPHTDTWYQYVCDLED